MPSPEHTIIISLVSTLLELENFTVELPTPQGWVRPVNEVSLRLEEGEALGLVGESGCGKTMLSLGLMGLDPHGARHNGCAWFEVSRDGMTARVNLAVLPPEGMCILRGRQIAMIFQEPMTALDPVMRIGAQIEEAIRAHEPSLTAAEIRRRSIEALERAAVPEPERRARQFPHQLSGGLRQRSMIAMALSMRPRLLIADEPTTALDVTVQKQILELLQQLRQELHLTLLFITHDLGVVSQIADRIAVMYAGRIVESGPANDVLTAPRHPYTKGLLRAAPRLEGRKVVAIPGTVPRLDALPPGCAFAPRCEYHRTECDAAVPDLREALPNHCARCILVQ
ncbi:MAG TPA: ABC transporter ATP-binding protein [Candidatus Acidoferrales bacterium]|nr:ABC transporter ATP-binding protein [Candidatus Acidoferrales bacterium]